MNSLNASSRYILIAMILMTAIFMVYCRYTAYTIIAEPLKISSFSEKKKEGLVVSPTRRVRKCCLNDPKYSVLGYDNPYIFPYNYCLNLNEPTKRFSLPGWARRVKMSEKSSLGFPGYMY